MILIWMMSAVVSQWVCVTTLRASEGFRRPVFALLSLTAMVVSMGSVSVALSLGLSVAVAYGIWTGLGVALAAVTGWLVFHDQMNRWQLIGLLLILAGVVGLQL